MPDLGPDPGQGPGATQTIAPPDQTGGGVPQSGLGGSPSPSSNLPPSGAPGASPVEAHGKTALADSYMAGALMLLHLAVKSYPPGESMNNALKLYQSATKHFKMLGAQGQGGPPGGMPAMPGAAPGPQAMSPPAGPPPGAMP